MYENVENGHHHHNFHDIPDLRNFTFLKSSQARLDNLVHSVQRIVIHIHTKFLLLHKAISEFLAAQIITSDHETIFHANYKFLN